MTAVCAHVPYDATHAIAVTASPQHPQQVQVHCPCCGLTGWREPEDLLDGDLCPYCGVQARWT